VAVRIAHFSDLHVTADPRDIAWHELLSKRFVGWLNLKLSGRHAAMLDAVKIARAFVEDIQELSPDHVLFTGDVTGLSLPSEFECARATLETLVEARNTTGIPGNHDVYLGRAAREDYFGRWFGEWLETDLQRSQLPGSLQESYPWPLVRLIGDEVAIICLRDSRPTPFHDSSGLVSEVQMRAAEHVLDNIVGDRVKILALHYGLRRPNGARDGYFHRLRNDEEVLDLAERKNVTLLVHGHIHHRAVHVAGDLSPVAMANPGPLAYTKDARAYHIYTVNNGHVGVEARHFDEASGTFIAWPEASQCLKAGD